VVDVRKQVIARRLIRAQVVSGNSTVTAMFRSVSEVDEPITNQEEAPEVPSVFMNPFQVHQHPDKYRFSAGGMKHCAAEITFRETLRVQQAVQVI